MKYIKIIVVILILLLKTKAYAIGTIDTIDTVRFSFLDPTPQFDPGAYVKGMVYFDNGLSMPANTTFQFGSLGIINGGIYFNNATLQLTSDLLLGSKAIIYGPGTIDLNGYSIILSDIVSINDAITISGFNGTNAIEGNGQVLDFNNGAIINHGETVKINNIAAQSIWNYLPGIANFDVDELIAENSSFVFQEFVGNTVNFAPLLHINGNCEIYGINQYVVCDQIDFSSGILRISDNTTLEVTGNISGSDTGNDYPSKITLNGSHLKFTSPTAQINAIQLVVNGACTLSSVAPLTINDGSIDYCDILINPGATLSIDNRTTIIDNSNK